MIEKLRRTLESLQKRDINSLGYEARIRHQQKIDELRQRLQNIPAEIPNESSAQPEPVAPTA